MRLRQGTLTIIHSDTNINRYGSRWFRDLIHIQVLSGKCNKKICVETCALSANTAQHGQDKGNLFVWPVKRLQYLTKSLADSQVLVIYDTHFSLQRPDSLCV